MTEPQTAPDGRQAQYVFALEQLLALPATDVKVALNEASQLVAELLHAHKVDVFLYDPTVDTLIAVGTSDTPMGHRQHELGLNRLPLSNGGVGGRVFQTGECYRSGHVEQDPTELRGIKESLGVRSMLAVPLNVDATRRGIVQVDSAEPDQFAHEDLDLLKAVAHWVGLVLQRAEQSERLAQEAAERGRRLAADELVTILAHDLRAPLTALRGRLEMLHMRVERGGQTAYLRDLAAMARPLQRLERMIEDLLDAARLEQDLFTVTREPVDLVVLVRETAATLTTADAPIEVRTTDELPLVIEARRIQHALENLLSNAIKHSPPGVPVLMELRREHRVDGAWAVITVQDAGPGIAPERLPTLFTRFAAGRDSNGLGLGLYLARGIAEAHGGTLTVDSMPGKGSTFCLELPEADETHRRL